MKGIRTRANADKSRGYELADDESPKQKIERLDERFTLRAGKTHQEGRQAEGLSTFSQWQFQESWQQPKQSAS